MRRAAVLSCGLTLAACTGSTAAKPPNGSGSTVQIRVEDTVDVTPPSTDPLASVDFGFSDTALTLSISGKPTRLVGPECERIALFASATDYLTDLFAARSDCDSAGSGRSR